MADLPSGPIVKINDLETAQDSPITQALMVKFGQDINGLIDRTFSYQEFLTTGNFTVPAGVERLWVYGCGGGGGGASGANIQASSGTIPFGGSGGAGANPTWHLIDVTPGVTYAVTIGAGGAGGANAGNEDGQKGGDTSFGTLAYFGGGEPGRWIPHWFAASASAQNVFYESKPGDNAGSCIASSGGRGAFQSPIGPTNVPGSQARRGIIGAAGNLGSGNRAGGGGGGSIGNGGNGANGTGVGNDTPPTVGGRGAGGGAGAGWTSNLYDRSGAAGGPGYAMVVWF